jgi:SAM-dependent methyltransferase
VIEFLATAMPWDAAVVIAGPEGEGIGRRMVVPLAGEGAVTADLSPAAAIERLEQLRGEGLEYLLIGASVYDWFDAAAPLREHLESHYRLVVRDEEIVTVYALHEAASVAGDDGLPLPPVHLIRMTSGCYRRAHDPLAIGRRFQATSREGAAWISEMLARNRAPLEQTGSLLDFGCGCGRIIRNWKDLPGSVYGSDYNPHLVRWCADHLRFAQFRVNDFEPPLPYADDSFDLVYSISIFTHLDEPLQVPWMQELARVVRPGGLILVTVSGEERLRNLRSARARERLGGPFEAGELVVTKSERVGTNACVVYHPMRYVRETLTAGLELVDYASGGATDVRQDAVLLRRPA